MFFECVRESRKCIWAKTIITVEKNNAFAGGHVETTLACRHDPSIFLPKDPDTLVSKAAGTIAAAIRGAVVYDDQLPILERLRKNALNRVGHELALVIDRDDDAEAVHSI